MVCHNDFVGPVFSEFTGSALDAGTHHQCGQVSAHAIRNPPAFTQGFVGNLSKMSVSLFCNG
jgi:hypothetical protein